MQLVNISSHVHELRVASRQARKILVYTESKAWQPCRTEALQGRAALADYSRGCLFGEGTTDQRQAEYRCLHQDFAAQNTCCRCRRGPQTRDCLSCRRDQAGAAAQALKKCCDRNLILLTMKDLLRVQRSKTSLMMCSADSMLHMQLVNAWVSIAIVRQQFQCQLPTELFYDGESEMPPSSRNLFQVPPETSCLQPPAMLSNGADVLKILLIIVHLLGCWWGSW